MNINAKKLIQKLWRSSRKPTVLGAMKSDMEIAAISCDSDREEIGYEADFRRVVCSTSSRTSQQKVVERKNGEAYLAAG